MMLQIPRAHLPLKRPESGPASAKPTNDKKINKINIKNKQQLAPKIEIVDVPDPGPL